MRRATEFVALLDTQPQCRRPYRPGPHGQPETKPPVLGVKDNCSRLSQWSSVAKGNGIWVVQTAPA